MLIAQGNGIDFWLIGTDVYRSRTGAVKDIYGFPQDKRWECTHSHWERYRDLFSWAKDVS